MITSEQKSTLLPFVSIASEKWKLSFNLAGSAGCASQYENTAVMHA